jgi:hypothetical protein
MADAFIISYSRKDEGFVRELEEALEKRGNAVWVDVEDIPLTAEWRPEILSGIEGAETFVFVISPDSIASKECKRELDHATKHNKRLVPILRREVDTTTAPDVLESHNWVFFRESDDFGESLEHLVQAMDTDLEWVKFHTRLLTRAVEWEGRGRGPQPPSARQRPRSGRGRAGPGNGQRARADVAPETVHTRKPRGINQAPEVDPRRRDARNGRRRRAGGH